jgi:hypothetical protein
MGINKFDFFFLLLMKKRGIQGMIYDESWLDRPSLKCKQINIYYKQVEKVEKEKNCLSFFYPFFKKKRKKKKENLILKLTSIIM